MLHLSEILKTPMTDEEFLTSQRARFASLFAEDRAAVSAVIGGVSGAIAGSGANNAKGGSQVTKFINSRDILNKTIANGTHKAIARQTGVMNSRAEQLLVSGVRYVMSEIFSRVAPRIPAME